MDKINVGLVGFGYAGQVFHAPLIAACDELKLTKIATSKPDLARQKYPQANICNAPEEILNDDKINLVVIATPNKTHFPLALAAIKAGKNIVVDKPFTLNVHEAEILLAQSQAQQICLSVFHNRRFDSDFLTLQQIIKDGILGEIIYFESHFDRYRPEVKTRWRETDKDGGGLWYDLAPHLIDQAFILFGAPKNIIKDIGIQRENAQMADYFHAILDYGRLRIILHASSLVAAAGARFILHGTQGSATIYGLDTQEEALKNGTSPNANGFGFSPFDAEVTIIKDGVAKREKIISHSGKYLEYYYDIARAINQKTQPYVSAEQAVAVMKILAGDGIG